MLFWESFLERTKKKQFDHISWTFTSESKTNNGDISNAVINFKATHALEVIKFKKICDLKSYYPRNYGDIES